MAQGVTTIKAGVRCRNLGRELDWSGIANVTSLAVHDPRQGYLSAESAVFAFPASGAKGLYVRNVSAKTSGKFSASLFVALGSTVMQSAAVTNASGAQFALETNEPMYIPLNLMVGVAGSALSNKYSTFSLASRYGLSYEFVVLGY